jgi:hypothetical protein
MVSSCVLFDVQSSAQNARRGPPANCWRNTSGRLGVAELSVENEVVCAIPAPKRSGLARCVEWTGDHAHVASGLGEDGDGRAATTAGTNLGLVFHGDLLCSCGCTKQRANARYCRPARCRRNTLGRLGIAEHSAEAQDGVRDPFSQLTGSARCAARTGDHAHIVSGLDDDAAATAGTNLGLDLHGDLLCSCSCLIYEAAGECTLLSASTMRAIFARSYRAQPDTPGRLAITRTLPRESRDNGRGAAATAAGTNLGLDLHDKLLCLVFDV